MIETLEAAVERSGIEIAALTVRYPGRREEALDHVTVATPSGAILGVAGRTGAGKSTLALVAAGFVPRVVRARLDGRVVVAGVDAPRADPAELLGKVGIVFATPANQLSASKLTVREELAFGLENLAIPRAAMDDRIDAVLARLGIGHLADREPFALSGGEQQRVAIASIVAMGTDVLVLDEPTAQLDPFGTTMVADILAELAADGAAILVAEHDPAVLARTDRTLVLEQGRVHADGPPGVTLGPDALGPIGLRSPTIVRLAWLAGVAPELAFDEAAVAGGLEQVARMAPDRLAAYTTDAGAGAEPRDAPAAWVPVRDEPPAGITVEALVYRYPSGGVEALRGVSLAVEPGESVAILGQNGSGKTTLLKHLNGLLRPTAGRVLIADRDIAGEPVHRLASTVGLLFQNPDDQLFERSVDREIGFGPRNLGLPADVVAQLIEQALAATGLTDVRDLNPYDLDLSRRKLVALASVLALDPAVLVLDEPTTGQDAAGIRRVGAVVEALRATGRTVVAITHDMEFAASHFGRAVVMRGGTIVLDGPPGEVFGAAAVGTLVSAGITPPAAARIGTRLGLATPTEASLVAALSSRG